MNFFNIFKGSFNKNFRTFFKLFDAVTEYPTQDTVQRKLMIVLKNPAFLKVMSLQCDMFSLGKIYVYDDKGKEVDDSWLKQALESPNPFQDTQQFLWEFMFWLMLGESHIYLMNDSEKLIENKIYNLRPYRIELPSSMDNDSDKLILSEKALKDYLNRTVKYRYNDGSAFDFPYGNMISIGDLGEPLSRNNFPSRVDALYKVIANNEASLDSMNINIRYSGKFMVAGKSDPNDVTKLPLSSTEKEDIERKVLKDNPVEAVKSMIDIKRFVDNVGNQKLPEFYLHTYFVIGSMYNIPKDVLEAFNSGTFENQEKARGSHVSYSLQPKGNVLMGKLNKFFHAHEKNQYLVIDWEHLPFMQVFAEQRARAEYTKSQTLLNLQKAGVKNDDINTYLDTNFKFNEKPKETNTGANNQNQTSESQ